MRETKIAAVPKSKDAALGSFSFCGTAKQTNNCCEVLAEKYLHCSPSMLVAQCLVLFRCYQVFKNGVKVDSVTGSGESKLRKLVADHVGQQQDGSGTSPPDDKKVQ